MRVGGTRRRLLTLLVFAAVGIALLPVIVAKTPLRNRLLSAAMPSDQLRVTVGGASLSWFRGPSLSAVEVKDAAGNMLLAAESIGTDRAPGNLLLNPRDLGAIEIVRPTLHLAIRPDGSNLEDAVRKLLNDLGTPASNDPADANTRSQPAAFAVRLIEGTILAEDVATGRRWRIEHVDLQYDTRGAKGGVGRGTLAGQIVDGGGGAPATPAGRFAISLQPGDGGRQQLSLQTEGVALAAAEPWLRRFVAAAELSGTLSGQGTAAWTTSAAPFPSDLTTSGTLAIDRLDASAPALRGDRVRLLRVELPWRLTSQPSGLAIEDLQLRSDLGQLALRGRLDPSVFARSPTIGAAALVTAARHDIELRGAFDVARLATILPHTLRIRNDTTITSGTIEMSGRYQPNGDGQLVTGSLRTAQWAATSAGRSLRWDQPVSANFALRRDNGGTRLDSLKCDSEFLQANASGTPQQFTANAQFDLNRLAEQLGQFVDLSGIGLAGTGAAKIDWRQTGADEFAASASGDLAQLRVALPDGAVWAEPQLAIRGEAAGTLDPLTRQPIRVDTGRLQVNGDGDQLDARLTGAVGLTNSAPTWSLSIRASGLIARWLTRVRPWFAADPWQIDGQCELTATVRAAGSTFEATDSKLVVTDLRATAPGWNVNEPRVELAGDARWDGAMGEVAANSAQFVTSTVSLAARDVRYRAGQQSVAQLSGVGAFRADLARLAAWRTAANQAPQYQPRGEVTGNVRFAQQGDRITGELTATGQNLALASRGAGTLAHPDTASRGVPAPGPAAYETIWQEPQLTLRGLAAYESGTDRLAFEQLQIQSNTLQAAVSGQVERLSTAAEVNVNGTLNYDLAQLTPLLRPYIGNGIQLAGREQARFMLAGRLAEGGEEGVAGVERQRAPSTPVNWGLAGSSTPTTLPREASHWSRRVRAQLELPWSGANVYGLPIGAGRISTALGDGAVRIEPIALAVGEGRLTASPHVRLDPEPAELSLPPGPVITSVRISPEVSEAMLKFVAPVLAGATQSEGLFSLSLDGARVPLGEARRADAAGQLTVHSVRVVPGPMAQQWVGLAQQIEALAKRRDPAALAQRPPVTLLSVRDQQVNFRVVDGRVYHQNMEFHVGDVTMRSQGSVGLDETLSLTLHVPIQDAWIEKEPLLAGLKGQSLQVPISGTLTRPQMDQRAIANLSGQLIQSAAGQAIGGELNKALDKLFKSR